MRRGPTLNNSSQKTQQDPFMAIPRETRTRCGSNGGLSQTFIHKRWILSDRWSTTILFHDNFLEERRLRGPLWRKLSSFAATTQQQETVSSKRQLDHVLIITNSYKQSIRPRQPQKQYTLSSNTKTLPTDGFVAICSVPLVHRWNQRTVPANMTNPPIIQLLPRNIAAIKQNLEGGIPPFRARMASVCLQVS